MYLPKRLRMPLRKFFSILVVFILLFQNSPLAVLAIETEEEPAEEVVYQEGKETEDSGEEVEETEDEPESKDEIGEPQAESEEETEESQTVEETDLITEEVEDFDIKQDESEEEETEKTDEGFVEGSVVEKKEAEIFNNAYNPQKGGILELTKSEILDKVEEMEWVDEEGIYTTSREVRVGETYEIPELGGLKIEFTDISGEPGRLYVKGVSAPEFIDGSEVVGSAYDITSDMENGTFEYDLYLPKLANQDMEVKYSEDGETYEDVENEKQEFSYVKAEGLDHFTVFVVVSPNDQVNCDAVQLGTTPGTTCFSTIQEAVDAAALTAGDDEIIVSDGTYNENITVHTQVRLRADNQHQAVIDGAILINGPDLVEIDGFRIENGSTMFGGTVGGIITTGSRHRIVNNELVGDGSPCLYPAIHHTALPGDSLYVENNEIYDWCQGVYLNPSSGHVIQNNNFHDNLVGIGSDGLSNVEILNNNFENNTLEGFGSSNVGVGVDVHGNTFEGNGSGIGQYSGNQIDARDNWWGDSTGPFDDDNTDGSNPLENPGGTGDPVVGNVDYRDFVTLGTIQGRKYLDTNLNTWMDSDEYPGVQDWQINLYDSAWTQLSTMVTGDDSAVSGNVDNDQFRFEGLDAGTYYVCEEMQSYHLQNGPALGDNPRTRDGSIAHTDAVAVQNTSPNSSTEGPVCWEVEVDGSQVGYIKFGNVELEDPSAPEQTGYRDSDDEVYTCTGDFSSKPSISVEWTDEATGTTPPDNLLKYLREYSQTGTDGDWHGHEVYSDNHTNLRSFGFGEVIHYSRVKTFYDLNDNDRFDMGEPNSDWSNVCSITHDVTDPEVEITSHEDGDWVRREVTIEGEVHDDNLWRYWFVIQKFDPSTGDYTTVDGLNTQYDDGPDVDITFNWNSDAGGLDDGIYIVKLEARDKAMNKEPDQAPVVSDPEVEGDSVDWVTLNVDNTRPLAEITDPTEPTYVNSGINFSGRASDQNLRRIWLSLGDENGRLIDSSGELIRDSGGDRVTCASMNLRSGDVFDPNDWNSITCLDQDLSGFSDGEYSVVIEAWDMPWNYRKDYLTFTLDTEVPEKPTGIHIVQDGEDLGCGGFVNERYITVDWDDNSEPDLDHYDYQIREERTIAQPTVSEFSGNIRDEDGYYKYRVRAVDIAGNVSDWTDWCGVTLDREAPTPPENLSWLEGNETGDEIGCGAFTNSYEVTATWEDSIDIDSDVEYYKYRSYNPDTGWIWNDPSEIFETYRTGYFTEGEGLYGFAVKSVDKAGNESDWTSMIIDDSCKVTYDTTPPEVPVWQTPANDVYTRQSQNIILDWSDSTDASGSEVGYEYESYHVERGATWRSLDHCGLLEDSQLPNDQVGPGGSCVIAPASTFSRDGEYQRKVRAVDEAGNASDWSSTYSLFRDTVEPVSYVDDSSTADVVNDVNFEVHYEATDDRSGVKQVELFYRKDGGTWNSYGTFSSSPISVTVSGDGVYDFYTVAEDKADDLTAVDMNDGSNGDNGVGNVEEKDPVVEATVRVDRVSLSIVDIEFDKAPPIYKEGDVMELTIVFENNSPMSTGEAGDVLYAAVGLDRYTWKNHMYRGEMDLPDVASGDTGRVTFMIPIPAPGSDSSNPEYWTDDDAYTVSSVLRMRNGYKDYDHNNGNYAFEIDNTPPVVDLKSHEDGDILSGTETLLGDIVEDNPSHYNISLNPAPDGTCNNKQDTWDFSNRLWQETVYNDNTVEHDLDTTEFDDGYYMIRLAARDLAGNRDPMPNTGDGVSVEVVCVTIDNTAPTVDQLSDEIYYEGDEVPTIELTASDNHELATLEYSVEYQGSVLGTDSVDISSGTYDVTQDVRAHMTYFDTSVIEEGIYTVEYYVTDTVGHESTHYTVTYTIENVSPSIGSFTATPDTIEEGDTVDFAGSFTDPSYLEDGNLGGSPDDSNWTVEIDYGEGDGYQLVGTMAEPGSITDVHQYDEDGTYTVSMRVCEAAQADNPQSEETCDTATTTVTVNNPPTPAPAEENQPLIQLVGEQVLGAELIGRDVLAEEDEEEDNEGEVLGERTCDEKSEVSGYVYIDKDEDGEKDDNEEGIEGVTVEIYYYDEDGEKVDVTAVETDEDGYWKADLCPGTYKVKADKEDLPEKTEISNEELEIEVTDEDMESVDFSVKQIKGFNWLWLLIPLFLLLILVVLVALNRKKEEK